MSSRLVVVVGSLGVLGILTAACGGAADSAAPPKSPAQESAPPQDSLKAQDAEPSTIEEAQAQIARAQSDLDATGTSSAGGAAATPQQETKPSEPRPKTERPAVDACASPCRALASMRRAVNALCKMTGDTDNRCTDARRTLSDNESKVTPTCKCSS